MYYAFDTYLTKFPYHKNLLLSSNFWAIVSTNIFTDLSLNWPCIDLLPSYPNLWTYFANCTQGKYFYHLGTPFYQPSQKSAPLDFKAMMSLSLSLLLFPTAPTMSAVGKEPHLSSFFSLFHIQGTSNGLAVTNHALLSLVDTNLAQYTCMYISHWLYCVQCRIQAWVMFFLT